MHPATPSISNTRNPQTQFSDTAQVSCTFNKPALHLRRRKKKKKKKTLDV